MIASKAAVTKDVSEESSASGDDIEESSAPGKSGDLGASGESGDFDESGESGDAEISKRDEVPNQKGQCQWMSNSLGLECSLCGTIKKSGYLGADDWSG